MDDDYEIVMIEGIPTRVYTFNEYELGNAKEVMPKSYAFDIIISDGLYEKDGEKNG